MGKIIIIILVVVGLVVGGFFYYKSLQKKLAKPPTETEISPTTEPTEEPTPDEVAKDAYTISILNGSGIAGEASKVKTLIEDADFVVESTGNAENYDYDKTIIQAGSDVSISWLNELKAVLKKNYQLQTSVEDIASGASTDVVIIVGKNDADGNSMATEEDTPISTEAPTPTGSLTSTSTPTQTVTPTPSKKP